jgi:hypothetical protein
VITEWGSLKVFLFLCLAKQWAIGRAQLLCRLIAGDILLSRLAFHH